MTEALLTQLFQFSQDSMVYCIRLLTQVVLMPHAAEIPGEAVWGEEKEEEKAKDSAWWSQWEPT